MYKPIKGDTKTAIKALFLDPSGDALDISSATTKTIKFKKPDGTCASKTADFLTDGTDGYLVYLTEEDFLDTVGFWEAQGYIVMPTWTGHNEADMFEVVDVLCAS